MEHTNPVIILVGGVSVLLLLAVATYALGHRVRLPFTVLLVVVGVLLAQLGELGPTWLAPLGEFTISPDVILYVFLPTLIFESAFNLDARELRRNLLPVLTLAIPGLLISTAIIGLIVSTFTPIELPAALVLGAILSATDPVAVISLFKQLGAPKRLTILVEGESLFNDATSIVATHILLAVAVAGFVSTQTVLAGVADFFLVFLGGALFGWLAALGTGYLLGKAEDDPFIEITLTTILAYLSFLIAEHYLHVSGVMATVAAAITLASSGRAKISPAVYDYLNHFWEYMAHVANALIFLLVGLLVDLPALLSSWGLLFWVLVAMLISRALVVFGLVPVVGWLPNAEPVNRRYQAVMYWGGLRGAIALALALSLGDFAYADTFVALVTGAVLFTLLVPGLTIESLVHKLQLDQPPLSDRFARAEGVLSAKRRALARLPELQSGGLFSASIAERIEQRCRDGMNSSHNELETLRAAELDRDKETELLLFRSLTGEKSLYYDMFSKGHLSETAYRNLAWSIDQQLEALRYRSRVPANTLHPPEGRRVDRISSWILEKLLHWPQAAEKLRARHTVRDYEQVWGRHQGSNALMQQLLELTGEQPERAHIIKDVLSYYRQWNDAARARIDGVAEQFPEFVAAMQERLAIRMLIHAEREAIQEQTRAGAIPAGVAETMLERLAEEVREVRNRDITQLHVGPEELLRKVPFFQGLTADDFARVSCLLSARTIPAGQAIIRQGEHGDSLFLIARGVVRVARRDDGHERDLATLMAGDFFGEMALLHREPRTATCRAVTPCALYELSRADFSTVCEACPGLLAALAEADRKRASELRPS